MGPKTVQELLEEAEDLKFQLWYFMDVHKKEHIGIKQATNELLDLINELSL